MTASRTTATCVTCSPLLDDTQSREISVTATIPVVCARAESPEDRTVLTRNSRLCHPSITEREVSGGTASLPLDAAIVYASGRVPLRAMMCYGFALDVVGVAVIVAVLSVLGPLVLGTARP